MKPNKRLNLPTLIGFILVVNLGTLGVLCFGNSQWNRWIFVAQYYYLPELGYAPLKPKTTAIGIHAYGDQLIFPPEDFSGEYKFWNKDGSLNAKGPMVDGDAHGWWSIYNPNGELQYKRKYFHGLNVEYEEGKRNIYIPSSVLNKLRDQFLNQSPSP